jgi:hypothetical protein
VGGFIPLGPYIAVNAIANAVAAANVSTVWREVRTGDRISEQ